MVFCPSTFQSRRMRTSLRVPYVFTEKHDFVWFCGDLHLALTYVIAQIWESISKRTSDEVVGLTPSYWASVTLKYLRKGWMSLLGRRAAWRKRFLESQCPPGGWTLGLSADRSH